MRKAYLLGDGALAFLCTKILRSTSLSMSDGVMSILDTVPRIAGSAAVFPNPSTGKPYVTIHDAWHTARKRAGLQDVRLHDLRGKHEQLELFAP